MRWLRKLTLYLGGFLSVLVIVPALVMAWLLFTESGLHWAWQQAQPLLPVKVEMTRLQGSVWRGLRIQQLGIDASESDLDFESVSATEVSVRWQPLALLVGRVHIDQLSTSQLRLVLPAAEPEQDAASPVLPQLELPLMLQVDRLKLQSTEVLVGAEVIRVPDLQLQAAWAGSQLVIGSLRVRHDQVDYALAARVAFSDPLKYSFNVKSHGIKSEGRCWLDGAAYACDADLRWNQFSHPITGPMSSPSGQFTLALRGDLLDLVGRGQFVYPLEQAPIDTLVDLKGQVDFASQSARVQSFEARFAKGDVQASGQMHWRRLFDMELAVAANGVSLAHWLPDWLNEAEASTRSRLTLAVVDEGVDLAVHADQLDLMLGGKQLTGTLAFLLDPEGLAFPSVQLQGPGTALALSADWRYRDGIQFKGTVASEQLQALVPEIQGSLHANVSLDDRGELLSLAFDGESRGLAFGDWRADHLAARVQARMGNPGELHGWLQSLQVQTLQASADGLQLAQQNLGSAKLAAKGSAASHEVQASWRDGPGPVEVQSLALKGRWLWSAQQPIAASRWQGQLQQLTLLEPWHKAAWQLAAPTQIALSADEQKAAAFCLEQAAARLCSERLVFADGTLSSVGSLNGYALAREQTALSALAQPLTSGLRLSGALAAEWSLEAAVDALKIQANARWLDAGMSLEDADGLQVPLPVQAFEMQLAGDQTQAEVRGRLQLDDTQGLALSGVLNQWLTPGGNAALALKGDLHSLVYAQPFVPMVSELTGRLMVDLAASLPFSDADPTFGGKLELRDLAFHLPASGTRIADWQLAAVAGEHRLMINGQGRVGDGLARVQGEVTGADADSLFNAQLSLVGERLQLMNLPDFQLHASPDLNLQADGRHWHLSGKLAVVDSHLMLRQLPVSASGLSEDAKVYGEQASAENGDGLIQFTSEVTLNVERNVSFEGFGLQTDVAGGLRFTRSLDKTQHAQGIIRLPSGKFRSYGQRLDIDNGQIIFSGPIDNPALDVRAARKIDNVTAGIWLHGTARHPKTEVYSTPSMSEADALAYIVTGKSISESGSGEVVDMQTAALNLGLKQALPVLQRVGNQFGITDISLEDNAKGESSIAAGRRINDRIYVKYVYGLLGAAGDFVVQYNITDRLKIETSSGRTQAIDMTYSWDSKPPGLNAESDD